MRRRGDREGFGRATPGGPDGVHPTERSDMYAPRDTEEVEAVASLVVESYRYAGGH
ncbi:MAG: hypothetical protein AVDCRST_MAG14-1915 [uncultured Rubrobacteraceae bacterium]|uniref:Uncharacterized protein n=1 Tax=uncultured Rubrobacteraceae bacterium TaxID=349277 RepID=A0A6J4R3K8_9ACTN|nr:MAG: hypothetical protein AVDCRST_MAG14-1915 [uncultured Rubrobacteraceae bacterium]